MNTVKTTLVALTLAGTGTATVSGAVVAVAASGTTGAVARHDALAAPPGFDPAAFAHPVPNRFFPLTPGLVTRLRGSDEGERFVQKVRITHRTKMILGVRAVVVRDVVRRTDGTLAEKTDDWYANDDQGNVWYLGEATASYDEHGNLEDRAGSWEAGVDGAEPGIVMPAGPRPTMATRLELAKGEAEDQAWVVQRLGQLRIRGERFTDVVRTLEWSRLEPRVVSQKFYAAGLGIIDERNLSGGDEHFWLVSDHR